MTDSEDVQLPVVMGPKIGRPEVWSQELEDYICTLIVQGKSLSEICKREDMPSIITVWKWRRTRPSFSERYAQAREDQADTYADMMMQVAFDTKDDWIQDEEGVWKPNHDVVNRAKLKVDTLKWIVAKLKPGTYGERVEAKLTGEVKHAHLHAQVAMPIDASALDPAARDALRAALLPVLAPPQADDEDDGDAEGDA